MHKINNVISCYQQRIGKYDKQVWEQTVEQEVLKRLRSVPRKTAKVNTDLIDVDLFRGSAFSASKPNHGWVAITRMALFRTLFLPLYHRWWKSCIGAWVFAVICVLYVLQVITLIIFLGNSGEDRGLSSLSTAHVICPCIMMFGLALIHTQMMSAAESSPQYSRIRPGTKRKQTKSCVNRPSAERERDSGGSHDTGIDLNAEDGNVNSGRRPAESSHGIFHQTTNVVQSDLSKERADGEASAKVDSSLSIDLTSDITSAFEKTSDWVRKLSPSSCEIPEIKDFHENLDTLVCEPLSVNDLHAITLDSAGATGKQQPFVLLNLIPPDIDEIGSTEQVFAETRNVDAATASFCEDVTDLPRDINVLDVDSCGTLLLTCRKGNECGKISWETGSAANSNASLSDAAESSFISSLNGIGSMENSMSKTARNCSHGRRSDHVILPNLGLRNRKKSNLLDCQTTLNEDPNSSVKNHSTKQPVSYKLSREWNSSKEFQLNEKSPGWRSRSFVSSEEELDRKPWNLSTRQLSSRKNACNQTAKTDIKFIRSASDTLKAGTSSRVDGGRGQPRVKIIDTRQLESTGISSCESDCEERVSKGKASPKVATSEWEDTINTNTEMTSPTDTSSAGSSVSDFSEKDLMGTIGETSAAQGIQHASSVMNNLASNTDRVSCMIWEPNSVHKVDLTVMDIGWTIIQRVDKMQETLDYLILGFIFSVLLMFTPVIYRGYHAKDQLESLNYLEIGDIYMAAKIGFGQNWRQAVVIVNGMIQRLFLSLMFFFLLSVAERTFKQRLLYAKNFCYLTSSRRAKKYDLPHFRLNKVRNIKTWLSLRCFLKKRGPQRTVDSIVSAAFLLSVILLSILCIELLQGYGSFLDHLSNWELVMWCMSVGIYLLRFITLGTKINKKYRNFSVLITEQINLYLHMEQKPHKKEELMVANSVLKLAEDLLKELESPFKISGLSANPFLYNITKVVVLSAFSAVLTELLGFKLKLYKIKIRS